ncbi:MAG: NADH-quinone oxidoreductase subunit L, partial [Candidatus Eisenbacteria bacterium]
AGFFSKDEILWKAFNNGGPILWACGVVGAFMTAFYMFRLYFMTFHGPERLTPEAKHHLHESPNSMTMPLMILAVLSAIGGFVQIPLMAGGQRLDAFLEPVFADLQRLGGDVAHGAAAHGAAATHGAATHDPNLEITLMIISLAVALLGIFVAHRFYVKDPQAPQRLAEKARALYDLLWNKWWVDEIYDARIIQPIVRLSNRLWKDVDAAIVDGAVNGVGKKVEQGAGWLRLAQTGYVQLYALIITLGMVVVFGYLALR